MGIHGEMDGYSCNPVLVDFHSETEHRIADFPGLFSRAVTCVYSHNSRKPELYWATRGFDCDPVLTGSMVRIAICVVGEFS